jgi:hypothetical protein
MVDCGMSITKQAKKICKGCTIEKDREEFQCYLTGSKAGQLSSAYCKVCKNGRQASQRGSEEYQPRPYSKMTPELKNSATIRYRKAKRKRLQEYIMSVLIGKTCFDRRDSYLALQMHLGHHP